MGVGEIIRRNRAERGWTMREVARRAGVSPMIVSRLERGARVGHMATVVRILAVLDVPISVLEGIAADREPLRV